MASIHPYTHHPSTCGSSGTDPRQVPGPSQHQHTETTRTTHHIYTYGKFTVSNQPNELWDETTEPTHLIYKCLKHFLLPAVYSNVSYSMFLDVGACSVLCSQCCQTCNKQSCHQLKMGKVNFIFLVF